MDESNCDSNLQSRCRCDETRDYLGEWRNESNVQARTFSVVVQSQNASNVATNVVAATDFNFSVATGTGALGGTVSGTIAAGANSVTVTGVTVLEG